MRVEFHITALETIFRQDKLLTCKVKLAKSLALNTCKVKSTAADFLEKFPFLSLKNKPDN